MSDESEFNEIEALMRRAPLRQPPPGLDARISELSRRLPAPQRTMRLRLLAWSVAALMAISSGSIWAVKQFGHRPTAVVPTALVTPIDRKEPIVAVAQKSKPVGLVRTVSNFRNEGIIASVEGAPFRRYRRQSVQQFLLMDAKSGTHVAVTVPREEIVVVRVPTF
jgi:hypothetical protein